MKVLQNGRPTNFQKGQTVGAYLAGTSITKISTLSGVSTAAVSKAMTAYTNHGRHHQLRGTVAKNRN